MPSRSPHNSRADGAEHEYIAERYLTGLGYALVRRNFRFGRHGEIDLVMRDGPVYVFVEVKARRSHRFGAPEESITISKQRRVRRVAEGFIHALGLTDMEGRFDVVAIDYVTGRDGVPEIRHHINAF